jgi:pilus assembly protein FimV
MLDSILEEPLYLAGGAGVIALLIGLAVLSRRKNRSVEEREPEGASEAALGGALDKTLKQEAPAAPGAAPDEMAPVEEATKYLTLGRHAQAEEILNEALKTSPGQPALLLKLLEVHSSRNDRRAFQAVAGELLASTGGTGDIWIQAARLGFALDPQNSMYELGRVEADAAPAPAVGVATSDLDFDLNVVAPKGPTETDIDVNARHGAAQFESTHLMTDEDTRRIAGESSLTEPTPPASHVGGPMAVTDFNLDAGGDAVSTNFALDASQGGPSALDINFDLPPDELTSAPGTTTSNDIKVDLKKPDSTPTSSDILDFDLSGISLDLDATATGIQSSVTGAVKDDHWFDVQTKFDLAKAYQEMGDKESAREILKEVLAEGDAQQQAEAKALLEALA